MAPFKSTQSFSVGQFLKTFRNRDGFGPAALNSPVRTERTTTTIKKVKRYHQLLFMQRPQFLEKTISR